MSLVSLLPRFLPFGLCGFFLPPLGEVGDFLAEPLSSYAGMPNLFLVCILSATVFCFIGLGGGAFSFSVTTVLLFVGIGFFSAGW